MSGSLSDLNATHGFTARELGVIAGLANVWRPNPFPAGRTAPNYDHDEWQDGFHDGLAIRSATLDQGDVPS